MRFDIFSTRGDAHTRKAQEYLQAANLARIEHHVAAEHHSALAMMYAKRVAWLEQELADSIARYSTPLRSPVSTQVEMSKRGSDSIVTLPRAQRAGMFDAAQ